MAATDVGRLEDETEVGAEAMGGTLRGAAFTVAYCDNKFYIAYLSSMCYVHM